MITYRELYNIINNVMTDEQMDRPIQIKDVNNNIMTVVDCKTVVVGTNYGEIKNVYYMNI